MDEGELQTYLRPWLEVAGSALSGYRRGHPSARFGILGILLHWQRTQTVWYSNVSPEIRERHPDLTYVPEIDQYIEILTKAKFARGQQSWYGD